MQERIKETRKKSVLWGIIGGLLLLGIYFIIVTLANSLNHAIEEFLELWYWIGALTLGFGLQMGLFTYIRQTMKLKAELRGATSAVATGAGVSTISMVACCAHHVSDLLPVLGLSAVAAFMTQYRIMFILLGLISNLIGATYMFSIISRYHLYFASNDWLSWFGKFNYRHVFKIEIPLLVIIFFVGTLLFIQKSEKASAIGSPPPLIMLEDQQVAGNGVWIIVGGEYRPEQHTLIFNIRFNTHSGSLDFLVDEIASLSVNGRDVALLGTWEGSPPGGHHRMGKLRYQNVPDNARDIVLKLSRQGRIGVRKFEWHM